MEEQTPFAKSRRSYLYESSRGASNKRRIIMIAGGIIILVLLVAVAVIATGGGGEPEDDIAAVPTQTETVFPTEEPTPTPEEDLTPTPGKKTTPTPTKSANTSTVDKATGLDRADLTIAIENGGGVAGAASKASKILKDLGYEVASAGNADNFDYETTVILVKPAKKSYFELLKKDLAGSYTIAASSSATLSRGTADAILIVGKK